MAELERQLSMLPVEWPPAPDVAARLALPARRRRPAPAVAFALVALAAALAVPQSRSAILRFFHLRHVTVERVGTLPPAEERTLTAGLGLPVGDARARAVLGAGFLPAAHGTLYERGAVVSTLLPGPVLLSELGSAGFLKKFATSGVEWVRVTPAVQGLWIAGRRHVVLFPSASPRLAGNVLVWATAERTFRLEGRRLTEHEALRLARAVMGTETG
jgi:hypothetical protein